ncbi:beta-N-acetylhexosaminidase [Propioniciclava coleopterorum]|uniref:beta-N-acetylhexosaminidase n=1 Tax=Propioniciclava coleopterorum TaxID=2714937 RepID=A0A6G7Y4G4_9ACTN|nr:family 20 glycosylhydrolase [Propioniciclava coleopterorum]QIK71556.1 beta-N-acetylhexosaminidase [Propioniciclava coleopterorum]
MTGLTDPLDRVHALVPTPGSLDASGEVTELPTPLTVSGPADWATDAVARLSGLGAVPAAADGVLALTADDALPAGGYRLEVGEGRVALAASDAGGAASGISTLQQLLDPRLALPAAPGVPRTLARCTIVDAPAYPWRGAHVDVARHFFPIAWLFGFVDTIAAHKLNVFHLHLTDDQGWRFEVPGHPRLTQVGSHRPGTRFPTLPRHDGVPHGGFYTTDQLRALVEYARQRGITVVPEIDVPGHVRALLAAYPEYGWGESLGVSTEMGIHPEVLWPDEKALALVEDIFAALLDVFDSPIIHIGGDECPTDQWRDNPAADALVAEYGLDGVHQLQRWFTLRLVSWLAERGRRVIGWDEILDGGDVPGAIVMSWRGSEPGRRALAAGHAVVMAPAPTLYFDYLPSDDPDEPFARRPVVTWQDVASYDPAAGIPEAERGGLLGLQGQIWTEFLATTPEVEYLVWPRLAAVAQVGWSGPADPDAFEPVLAAHLARLDARGVNHRPLSGPLPWQRGGTGARRLVEWTPEDYYAIKED